MLAYLITPWTAIALWRSVRAGKVSDQEVGGEKITRTVAALFVVPFSLFLLLSFYKEIGLHWLLAFVPFVFCLRLFTCAMKHYNAISNGRFGLGYPISCWCLA